MAELPIACSLTGPELRERRETVLASIRARVQEMREIDSGIAIRFDPEGGILAALAELIELERRCCPFLQFDLRVLPANGPVWLELTGSDGTRDFLRDLLELPHRPPSMNLFVSTDLKLGEESELFKDRKG